MPTSLLKLIVSLLLCAPFAIAYPKASEIEDGYIKVTGGKLYYQIIGQGKPLLIIHGGPGADRTYLQPQLFRLAKKQRVIFYDQRGSGKSLETPLTRDYINIDRFVEDIESLRRHLHLKRWFVYGHSFGGFLAMQYAIAHPETLDGLILSNSAPASEMLQNEFLAYYTKKTREIPEAIQRFKTYDSFKKLSTKTIEATHRIIYSVYFSDPNKVNELNLGVTDLKAARSGFRVAEIINDHDLFKPGINLLPKLAKLHAPTLILHGRQDIVPDSSPKAIHDAIPGSQLIFFENSGHFPYIERPEAYDKAIEAFIAAH